MKYFTAFAALCLFSANTLAFPQYSYPESLRSVNATSSITSTSTVWTTATSTRPNVVPMPTVDPETCEKAAVYICEDAFWSGNCTLHHPCIGGGDATCNMLDGKASSIGPDPGFTCTFYRNEVCRDFGEGLMRLQYPGESNLLNTTWGDWNDAAHSYQCFNVETE